MDNSTLKEMYGYDYVGAEDIEAPLQCWYNDVLEKTEDELTVGDIGRMLRQRIFSKVAIRRAIEILSSDPFAGEMFEGQLMYNLYNAKPKYLCQFYKEAGEMLRKAEKALLTHEWESEESKNEYLDIFTSFLNKIKEEKI
ncbi:MAG: hypothetical protein IKQ90_04680 [Ruminococcus sp.]|nr:hypothetical protein [Ruminococcus sp.]